ncbi:MAG: protease modulator HflK [Verrucomicrobiota bacterium]
MKQYRTSELLPGLDTGMRMMKWLMGLLIVLFCFSGITNVKSGEEALVLRFGKLVKVQESGLLLALPYPIDEVIRVPVKQEGEVEILDIWQNPSAQDSQDAINPLEEGYCLTGDQNIVQMKVVVKYRISDSASFRLLTEDSEQLLREVVVAAITTTLADWQVDEVIRLQRSDSGDGLTFQSLYRTVLRQTEQRLADLECGVTISALEIKEVLPARQVLKEFREVQSAKIEMETMMRQAEDFRNQKELKAQEEANRMVKEATASATRRKSEARAHLSVFKQLHQQYSKEPDIFKERMRIEFLETIYNNVGRVELVSPDTRIIFSSPKGEE